MDLSKLNEAFPESAVSKRAQMVSERDGKFTALALSYIDARDVMERLDTVVGAENWQDSYVESARGRIICTISIFINGQWVSKSDGAGDTDVEAEKGAISDAFKRAAVKWGIGRYLYERTSVWLPCTAREDGKDKWGKTKYKFVSWIESKPERPKAPPAKADVDLAKDVVPQVFIDALIKQLNEAATIDDLENLVETNRPAVQRIKIQSAHEYKRIVNAKENRKATLASIKQGGLD